ncbi:MAG: hypothetical protein QOF60_578 [Actinomycetota bacterium]|jgi:prevent-host-death family protein|nr:hypothetical protein [Actinomycetota bacterium]
MMTMTATEARAALPALLDQVLKGEEVTITRHGKPVAVLVGPDALRRRKAEWAFKQADELAEMMAEARKRPISTVGIPSERAEQLVAEIYADRERAR